MKSRMRKNKPKLDPEFKQENTTPPIDPVIKYFNGNFCQKMVL